MPEPTSDGLPDDIQQSLSRCFEELDNVIREQSDEQQQKLVVPPMLYHYTDGAALFGVIEGGAIRLSDIYGLNDPSEIRHGLEIACERLEQHSKDVMSAPHCSGWHRVPIAQWSRSKPLQRHNCGCQDCPMWNGVH